MGELSEDGCMISCPRNRSGRYAQVNAPDAAVFEIEVHDIDPRWNSFWAGYAEIGGTYESRILLSNKGKLINRLQNVGNAFGGFNKNDIVKIEFCKSCHTIMFDVNGEHVGRINKVQCDDVVLLPTVVIYGGNVSLHSCDKAQRSARHDDLVS